MIKWKVFSEKILYAPVSGRCIPLEEVNDKVFAEKVVGDGIAIRPTGGDIVAPCDGTITHLFTTKHGIGMQTRNGIDLLIHIGIDTVYLNGAGFSYLVALGDKVKRGTPLVTVDWAKLEEKGMDCITPMIITNMEKVRVVSRKIEDVFAGKSPVLEIALKK